MKKLPIFSHENPNLVGRSVSQCISEVLHDKQLAGMEGENNNIESMKNKCEPFFENRLLLTSLLKDGKNKHCIRNDVAWSVLLILKG